MADLYRQTTDDITIEFEDRYEDQFETFAKYSVSTCDLLTADPRLVGAWGEQKVLKCHGLATDLEKRISEQISMERVDFDLSTSEEPADLIRTGVSKIDTVLHGGIPTGTLCEVAGESAAGKSHFLLQLCVNVQLAPGNGGVGKKAVFISTESGLETRRLVQMMNHVTKQGHGNISLERVSFIACKDLEQQDRVFQYNLPNLLEDNSYGLVVIDSLAAHYRSEELTSKGDFSSRDKRLLRTLHNLKGLTRKHNVAIVFANQISALPGRELSIGAEILPTLLEKQLPYFSGWKIPIVSHTQDLRAKQPDPSQDFMLSSSQSDTHPAGSPMPSQISSQHSQPSSSQPSFQMGSKMPTLGQVLANSVDIRMVLKHSDAGRTFEVVYSNPYRLDTSVVPYEITTGALVDKDDE
ncbi:DNA repair and recombination protein [Yarrowia sp. B02]|nr:DNA repair and recombination protein [Yarrowia sp. B02]